MWNPDRYRKNESKMRSVNPHQLVAQFRAAHKAMNETRERILAEEKAKGLEVIEVHDELIVTGYSKLEARAAKCQK